MVAQDANVRGSPVVIWAAHAAHHGRDRNDAMKNQYVKMLTMWPPVLLVLR